MMEEEGPGHLFTPLETPVKPANGILAKRLERTFKDKTLEEETEKALECRKPSGKKEEENRGMKDLVASQKEYGKESLPSGSCCSFEGLFESGLELLIRQIDLVALEAPSKSETITQIQVILRLVLFFFRARFGWALRKKRTWRFLDFMENFKCKSLS